LTHDGFVLKYHQNAVKEPEMPELARNVLREFREDRTGLSQAQFGDVMEWGGENNPNADNGELERNMESGRKRFTALELARMVKVCEKQGYNWIVAGDSWHQRFEAAIEYEGALRRETDKRRRKKQPKEPSQEPTTLPPEEPEPEPISTHDAVMQAWGKEIDETPIPPKVDDTQATPEQELKEEPKEGQGEVETAELKEEEPQEKPESRPEPKPKEPESGQDEVKVPPVGETKTQAKPTGLLVVVALVIVTIVAYRFATSATNPVSPTNTPPAPSIAPTGTPTRIFYQEDSYTAFLTPVRYDNKTLMFLIEVRSKKDNPRPTVQPGIADYGMRVTYASLREDGIEYKLLTSPDRLGNLIFKTYWIDNVGPITFEVPENHKQMELTIGWQEESGTKYMNWTIPSIW
jgi:hypothetical protein